MKGAVRPALRYAKAILNLAKEQKVETEVNDNMKLISATIAENSELDAMLKSPVIKAADKRKVLAALFGEKVNNIVKGLFNLLEENKRMIILDVVAKQYTYIYEHYNHFQVAKVTTAVPLTKELETKVLAKVEEITGDKASIENIVNPEILGGFILRVGDIQYDASIANQFTELRRQFDDSHYIPQI